MTAVLNNPAERVRFFKFMVVGAMGAVVDFGVMNLLTHFTSATLVVAGTISFICAVTNNFLWNRYWVYPDSRSKHVAHQMLTFFIVNFVGILIRIPILHFLEPVLYDLFQQFVSQPLADLLARNLTLAIAVGIVMMWNFFVNRYWTYNDVEIAS